MSTIRSKKLAATFFFHQHVIAILQIRRPSSSSSSSSNNGGNDDTVWFDIIDSLPHRETLQRINGNSNTSNGARSQLDNAAEWMHNQWDGVNEWVDNSIGGNGSTRDNSGKSSNSNNSGIDNTNYYCDSSLSSPTSSSPISAEFESLGIQQQPNAARIRCFDAEALKATLQWYAFSVFTSENANYIDTYQWDEKLTDFDPRVFQAFLWKEA